MQDLQVKTHAGKVASLNAETIEKLRQSIRGKVLTQESENYNEARTIWNAMIDKRPALIVRCAGAADVMRAVRFAAEHKLLLAVRGGGHNIAGNAVCDGGLMIDL
jgi:FAD/FMN-containing dehydrogenase